MAWIYFVINLAENFWSVLHCTGVAGLVVTLGYDMHTQNTILLGGIAWDPRNRRSWVYGMQ